MKNVATLVSILCLCASSSLFVGCFNDNGRPSSDFTADKTSGYAPLTVQFSDKSNPGNAPITAWLWDFGDGDTSAQPNPSHLYKSVSTYSVSLTVTNKYGADTRTNDRYIQVRPLENPKPEFTASQTSGLAPLEVQFEDNSTAGSGKIISWAWDFGDDSTSTQPGNVKHTYSVAGLYTVTLELTSDDHLFGQTRKKDFIKVDDPVKTVSVPAGWFRMGADSSNVVAKPDEMAAHFVKLDAYQIGKYEVTNAEYCVALNWARGQNLLDIKDGDIILANNGPVILGMSKDSCDIRFDGTNFLPKERDGKSMASYPAVMVTWVGAAAFCNWFSQEYGLAPCYDSTWQLNATPTGGFRLATEAEWECAAGWDNRRQDVILPNLSGSGYLWTYGMQADEIDTTVANFDSSNPLGLSKPALSAPVGHYATSYSPVGCYDMSGNVREWCYDLYAPSYSPNNAINPTGPAPSDQTTTHVTRGGSWASPIDDCRTTRRFDTTELYSNEIGFRVARWPLQKTFIEKLYTTIMLDGSDDLEE